MTVIRYTVDDLPARGLTAFTPTLTVTPLASSGGLAHVFGAPGTMAVPAPAPPAVPNLGPDPKTSPSNCAPSVIFPAIYLASPANMGPPVRRRSTNELPIPATSYLRVPRVAMPAPHIGGRRVIPWPRVFQRWGSVTGTQGG